MTDSPKLTARQQEILELIQNTIANIPFRTYSTPDNELRVEYTVATATAYHDWDGTDWIFDATNIWAKNWQFKSGGDLLPGTDDAQNIGTALLRVRKIFASTIDICKSAFGYAAGAGGVVTQITSKATGVTLNKPSGCITTDAAALASGATVEFVLTNSEIALNDVITTTVQSPGAKYRCSVTNTSAGGCTIELTNKTGGRLSEAVKINFAVLKVATA